MSKGDWGKVKAYFTLITGYGFLINGMRLIEGTNGLFVGYPSKQKKKEDGSSEYDQVVRPMDKDIANGVQEEAIELYENNYGKNSVEKTVEEYDDDVPF